MAQGRQPACGALGQVGIAPLVDQHDAGTRARHQAVDVELQPAVGRRHRKEGMALTELARLAHIEQRDPGAVLQPAPQVEGGDGT
ncbi:hypothetical protein R9X41_20740 [Xylophilus sp. GOD-11R]|nr:hypothetical protein [Xylophilus sp. GOD-11R]WPB56544.1 hypothetical protein R9X41_20740 [Xylophilus sp. GOD-11R]